MARRCPERRLRGVRVVSGTAAPSRFLTGTAAPAAPSHRPRPPPGHRRTDRAPTIRAFDPLTTGLVKRSMDIKEK